MCKNKAIDVPPLQQLSIPSIGNVICSPTSVAMVLNHYGYTFTQQEMAKKVYDNRRSIYGIWYGIFNDPAAYEDSKVERKYSLSQVLNVWRQYTYIIVEQPNDLN